MLDRYPHDLKHHVKDQGRPPLDKAAFLGALESALAHLHNLGLAHNDLNPANILISETGMPLLIDFDSCRPIGQKLLHSRGTPGWTDECDRWDISETRYVCYRKNPGMVGRAAAGDGPHAVICLHNSWNDKRWHLFTWSCIKTERVDSLLAQVNITSFMAVYS